MFATLSIDFPSATGQISSRNLNLVRVCSMMEKTRTANALFEVKLQALGIQFGASPKRTFSYASFLGIS